MSVSTGYSTYLESRNEADQGLKISSDMLQRLDTYRRTYIDIDVCIAFADSFPFFRDVSSTGGFFGVMTVSS